MAFEKTRRLIALSAWSAALLVAGCGNRGGDTGGVAASGGGKANGTSGADLSGTLRIISPHPLETTDEFKRAFNAKYPNLRLQFSDHGGTGSDLKYVLSRFKGKTGAQGINTDVFFGGGGETFLDLDKAGALAPIPSDYGVPAQLNGVPLRGKTWVAATLSGFGILANKAIADRDSLPMPKTWADLADPKYQGRLELADPRHSGSAHASYEIILQSYGFQKGWQILTGLSANSTGFINSSSQLTQDVSGGQAVFVPAIDFYARTPIEKSKGKLVYIAPQGQSVITPDPIAILRGAPNASGAKLFVDFVMSPEGQKLWMLEKGAPGGPTRNTLYRQAAIPALYQPIPQNSTISSDPYETKNLRPYDATRAALRRRVLDDLIGAVLVDNQAALKSAWKVNPDAAKLAFLPCSEAQLDAYAAKWNDESAKTPIIAAWARDAAKHYGG